MSEVENIKRLLLEGKLNERINKESKIDLWKNISLLFFQESSSSQDNEYSGFALCKLCRKPLKHDRKRRSHLREHIVNCEKNEKDKMSFGKQAKLTGYFQTRRKNLGDAEKCKMNSALLNYVAYDIRPFKSVEDNGFKAVVQFFVKLGAQHGLLNLEDVLPSRHTVNRLVVTKASDLQKTVMIHVLNAVKENKIVGITTDM